MDISAKKKNIKKYVNLKKKKFQIFYNNYIDRLNEFYFKKKKFDKNLCTDRKRERNKK
jgi:hypothetical protein